MTYDAADNASKSYAVAIDAMREKLESFHRVQIGDCVLELMDGSAAQCCIIGTRNATSNKIERIAFMGPRDPDTNHYTTLFSKERKQVMPSLVAILHQVLDQQGTDYADIMTMKEETRRIALPENDPKHLAVSVGE